MYWSGRSHVMVSLLSEKGHKLLFTCIAYKLDLPYLWQESSNTSYLFKHLKIARPESYSGSEQKQENAQTSRTPAPSAVRQKMLRESFQSGTSTSGTVISYYLYRGSCDGNVSSLCVYAKFPNITSTEVILRPDTNEKRWQTVSKELHMAVFTISE